MTTDQELEETLRRLAAVGNVASPTPTELARIAERRARGDRVIIPHPGEAIPRARRIRTLWVAAIAAGLVLAFAVQQRQSGASSLADVALVPGMLVAQTSPTPAFPVLKLSKVSRLRPGRWVYVAEPISREAFDTTFIYQLEPTTYKGSDAWLVVTGMQVKGSDPAFTDSTWLSRSNVVPLSHWTDTTEAWKPVFGNGLALLQSVALDSTWRASVPLLANHPDPNAADVQTWLNLAVYGEEDVLAPAGRFRCWKVGFRPSKGFFFWVTEDGTLVRQGMERPDNFAFGRMNLALLSHEPL